MPPWFTVEQIDPQTFAISEYGHWEEPHCYLLCGKARAVLIDTGLGVSDIRKTVDELTNLPVTAVLTHAHWDHVGGLRSFDRIAVHELEENWLSDAFPLPLMAVKNNLTARSCAFPPAFDINAYEIFRGKPQFVLHDGDRLDLGEREIRVIHTPGHSPGHCCFYEPERKYLYTGDLIYQGCRLQNPPADGFIILYLHTSSSTGILLLSRRRAIISFTQHYGLRSFRRTLWNVLSTT